MGCAASAEDKSASAASQGAHAVSEHKGAVVEGAGHAAAAGAHAAGEAVHAGAAAAGTVIHAGGSVVSAGAEVVKHVEVAELQAVGHAGSAVVHAVGAVGGRAGDAVIEVAKAAAHIAEQTNVGREMSSMANVVWKGVSGASEVIGQASGLAAAVVSVIGGIYMLLEASATKAIWLGDFREELKIIAFDLAGSQAAFKDNGYINKLDIEIKGVDVFVRTIAGRGRFFSLICSFSDRQQLDAYRARLQELRNNAITGMLNSIQNSINSGTQQILQSVQESNERIMQELRKMQKEAEEKRLQNERYHKQENFTPIVNRIYRREYAPGSLAPLLQEITAWANEENGGGEFAPERNIFWVEGDTCSGKSVLSAAVISEVIPMVSAIHIDEDINKTGVVWKSIALQLATIIPEYNEMLKKSVGGGGSAADIGNLDLPNMKLFHRLFLEPFLQLQEGDQERYQQAFPAQAPRYMIVIDGIERFPQNEIQEIFTDKKLLKSLPSFLGFFITSKKVFKNLPCPIRINLEDNKNERIRGVCTSILYHHVRKAMKIGQKKNGGVGGGASSPSPSSPSPPPSDDAETASQIKECTDLLCQRSEYHLWYGLNELNAFLNKTDNPLTLADVQKFDKYNLLSDANRAVKSMAQKAQNLKNNAAIAFNEATSPHTSG